MASERGLSGASFRAFGRDTRTGLPSLSTTTDALEKPFRSPPTVSSSQRRRADRSRQRRSLARASTPCCSRKTGDSKSPEPSYHASSQRKPASSGPNTLLRATQYSSSTASQRSTTASRRRPPERRLRALPTVCLLCTSPTHTRVAPLISYLCRQISTRASHNDHASCRRPRKMAQRFPSGGSRPECSGQDGM